MIDDWIWIRHSITRTRRNSDTWSILFSEYICLFKYDWLIANDWDADSLEYCVTKNSGVAPSEHLLSLHPSVFWISEAGRVNEIWIDFSLSMLDYGLLEEMILLLNQMNWQWRVWLTVITNWSDLPSLSTFQGYEFNYFWIGRVILESDDWWLNLN